MISSSAIYNAIHKLAHAGCRDARDWWAEHNVWRWMNQGGGSYLGDRMAPVVREPVQMILGVWDLSWRPEAR